MVMVLRIRQFFLYVSLFGLFTAITLETNSSIAAPVARLEDWRFYPEAFQLEINLSAGTTPRYFYLAQPPRMVIDLPDTKLGSVATQQNYSGAIQKIRVSQLNANVTRIVLDLAPGTSLDPNQVQLQPVSAQNNTRWVLRPLIAGGTYSQQGNYPPPNNLPPSNYNYPPPNNLPPSNLPPSNYNYPPPNNLPPSNLPPSNYNNSQIPLVTVPALNSNNPTQQPGSVLPPPSFPNQPGNFNTAPLSVGAPGFPVQTVPNYPVNVPNSGIFEFGQPFPNSNR